MHDLIAPWRPFIVQAFQTTQLEKGNWRKRTTTWHLNSQPTLYHGVSATQATSGRDSPTPITIYIFIVVTLLVVTIATVTILVYYIRSFGGF